MKKTAKNLLFVIMGILLCFVILLPLKSKAADETKTDEQTVTEQAENTEVISDAAAQAATVSGKSLGAGLAIGIAAAGGAVAMGLAVAKSSEGISRQPEAEGQIRTTLMLGLVFIETAIIYALLAVILIIFVL